LASQKAVVDAKRRPRKPSNMQEVEMCRRAPQFPVTIAIAQPNPSTRIRKNGEKMIYVDAIKEGASGRKRKANNNREK